MVGERYRDLLSAADSIVRMRGAAEKLVQRLDRVESEVEDVAGTRGGSVSSRGACSVLTLAAAASTTSKRDLKSPVRTVSPEMDRTLASSPALSLTIHLFLSLPSLVHSLLESSAFLPATRLEGIGRVLYRELSNYSSDGSQDPGHLKDSFPIVERQWESVGSLGAVIARRATAELRIWETDAIVSAATRVDDRGLTGLLADYRRDAGRHLDPRECLGTFDTLAAAGRTLQDPVDDPECTITETNKTQTRRRRRRPCQPRAGPRHCPQDSRGRNQHFWGIVHHGIIAWTPPPSSASDRDSHQHPIV
jgi:hypothetical protein